MFSRALNVLWRTTPNNAGETHTSWMGWGIAVFYLDSSLILHVQSDMARLVICIAATASPSRRCLLARRTISGLGKSRGSRLVRQARAHEAALDRIQSNYRNVKGLRVGVRSGCLALRQF